MKRHNRADQIAVCAALMLFALLAGFFLRDALRQEPVIVETEKTPAVTVEAEMPVRDISVSSPSPEPPSRAANPVPELTREPEAPDDGRLDLNTATREELEALPGIGEVKAQAILDYRAEHGAFSSVEELLEVSGIGEKTLAGLYEYVKVEDTK